ncbi:MAG: hypothetical protein A3G41_06490 [Elusimicrobia bacterium RIFCSPLOWO2_12_FULL_59_9]|nr:MAG: hypothetical protein A3G41_06490 [Elusimicrobia bacterium RIFCSPLOWO2_12_FULL_59_9]
MGDVPEEGGVFSGAFIPPNEYDGHLFAPALKAKKGALISVGTFRALNDAALGDFSHVIIFDHDRAATAFNRRNLELILTSQDRFQYLMELFDRPLDQDLLASVRAGGIAESVFLQKLLRAPRNSWNFFERLLMFFPPRPRPQARAVQEALEAAAWDATGSLVDSIMEFAKQPQRWQNSYFGSSGLFSAIQSQVREKRIAAVNGSLTGEMALKAVADRLKHRGIQVSVLDVSNAHQTLNDWPRFIQNLRALPFSPNAVIVATAGWMFQPAGAVRADDGWAYFAVSAKQLLKAARGMWDDWEVFLASGRRP